MASHALQALQRWETEPSAVIGLHAAFQFEHQWLAFAVQRFAGGHFDPALADAILFYVGSVFSIELDAHIVLKHFSQVVRAAWVDGQAVRQKGA